MYRIEKILKMWKAEAKADRPIQYHFSYVTGELILCTSQPGLLIGLHGTLVDKYRDLLKNSISEFKTVRFQEVERYYI